MLFNLTQEVLGVAQDLIQDKDAKVGVLGQSPKRVGNGDGSGFQVGAGSQEQDKGVPEYLFIPAEV